MTERYRWATAEETEDHLNSAPIPGAIWVGVTDEQDDLAVPINEERS